MSRTKNKALIVIGAQWGDEGKGKAVDFLSEKADFVVRFQGGANAGHTLQSGDQKIILHLIPSGVLRKNTVSVIAGGVVLDPKALALEIQQLQEKGFLSRPGRLLVSDSASLVLEIHKQLDQARESAKNKIGATGKGIGPAYESRVSRKGLIFSDLFLDPKDLFKKLRICTKEAQFLLKHFYRQKPAANEEMLDALLKQKEKLRPFRCKNASRCISEALAGGKHVLFEGAQGALLDLMHGTWPYVTGSSTIAAAALTGAGLGPRQAGSVTAVMKAYTTRVGLGPFPTECPPESAAGRFLQKEGGEWGATTGRQRRCGWLDIPALKYALRLNGAQSLCLMKLDVLSGLKEIKVCCGYSLRGKKSADFPSPSDLSKASPVYRSFPGWTKDLSSVSSLKDLPKPAKDYVGFISQELGLPFRLISLGPRRAQTFYP